MHSASDKHSHAFARYALLAAIGTFSSQSSRDPLNGSARAYARRLAARLRSHSMRLRSHSMMSSPIATGSSEGNLPRAASRPCVDNATTGNLFRDYFFPASSDRPPARWLRAGFFLTQAGGAVDPKLGPIVRQPLSQAALLQHGRKALHR